MLFRFVSQCVTELSLQRAGRPEGRHSVICRVTGLGGGGGRVQAGCWVVLIWSNGSTVEGGGWLEMGVYDDTKSYLGAQDGLAIQV